MKPHRPSCSSTPHHCSAHLFADLVRARREELGLSIARAATLAGLLVYEWLAMECALLVPDDQDQLRNIADALQENPVQVSITAAVSSYHQH